MRRSRVLSGCFAAAISAFAFAQQTGAAPGGGGGPPDASAAVKSDSLGMPGQSTDLLDQYYQQKSLNNLPNQKAATTDGKQPRSRPATAAELVAGATVHDKTGVAMGTIEKIDPDGVVVATATGKVKIPADAIGHNKAGLLLDTSKAQFDQIVAKANAAPSG